MSQEGSYTENRQKKDEMVGNNLDKPQLFLKRKFNRDTTLEAEKLAKEGVFEKQK